ncbi:MAG TPA: hypothetical protein VGL72_28455 [Bryobacteraceae bacterium]|jgi:hypothetical protein
MKPTFAAAVLLLIAAPAAAHRLDEYLQATLISVAKDHVQAEIRLTPGVAVLPIVLRDIDADGDGMISESEQRAYAGRVLRDLSLTVDGVRLRLWLISWKFPDVREMKEGLGQIQIELAAEPPAGGLHRSLVFENRHHARIAAYLVNCLVPRDPDIRITTQNRNYEQSSYRVDYDQAGAPVTSLSPAWLSSGSSWLAGMALLFLTRFILVWRQRRTALCPPPHSANLPEFR